MKLSKQILNKVKFNHTWLNRYTFFGPFSKINNKLYECYVKRWVKKYILHVRPTFWTLSLVSLLPSSALRPQDLQGELFFLNKLSFEKILLVVVCISSVSCLPEAATLFY